MSVSELAPSGIAGETSPARVVADWLARFESALAGRDVDDVLALFEPDA